MEEPEYRAYKSRKTKEIEAMRNYESMITRLQRLQWEQEDTADTADWLPPIHITVWQAGMLLGLSDDDVRYYMQAHAEDAESGIDIGQVKTGKTGRHTYWIQEDKLCKELGINRTELRRIIKDYCKPEYRRSPRNVNIFAFLTINAFHGLPANTLTQDIMTGQARPYTYTPDTPLVDRTGRLVIATILPYRIAEGLGISYGAILEQIKR